MRLARFTFPSSPKGGGKETRVYQACHKTKEGRSVRLG